MLRVFVKSKLSNNLKCAPCGMVQVTTCASSICLSKHFLRSSASKVESNFVDKIVVVGKRNNIFIQLADRNAKIVFSRHNRYSEPSAVDKMLRSLTNDIVPSLMICGFFACTLRHLIPHAKKDAKVFENGLLVYNRFASTLGSNHCSINQIQSFIRIFLFKSKAVGNHDGISHHVFANLNSMELRQASDFIANHRVYIFCSGFLDNNFFKPPRKSRIFFEVLLILIFCGSTNNNSITTS